MSFSKRFNAEYLPDPRLAEFEADPPGYIRVLGPLLENCYIKVAVSVPVMVIKKRGAGFTKVHCGDRRGYMWEKLKDD